MRLTLSNKLQLNGEVISLNPEHQANPYIRFWGVKAPLLRVEQVIESHSLVRKCLAHVTSLVYPCPEIVLVLELEPSFFKNQSISGDVKSKESLGSVSEADSLLKKELTQMLKNHLTDSITLQEVSFFIFVFGVDWVY